jgi:hypothetical protein
MESKVKIAGHGVHPILIVVPLGLLATSRRFQTAVSRKTQRAHGRIRTCGLLLRRQSLYPLSYVGGAPRSAARGVWYHPSPPGQWMVKSQVRRLVLCSARPVPSDASLVFAS